MEYRLTEKEFEKFRPKSFFFITTNKKEEFTVGAFKASLTELKKYGFGGIVLFNKPQDGFNEETYLSKDFFYMVKNACKVCKDLGLEIWINDAYDYPPGAVAGRVKKIAPHLKQKHIKLIDGVPTVLEADWGFPAFEEPLSEELFRTLVYEEYYKHVGEYFGDPIKGFFSDTDNRRVEPSTMFNENSPMRDYFPWSADFENDFKAAYGYGIMPYMNDIMLRKDIPQAADYWEFAGRLYQRWWKGNAEWIHAHGLKYTGHSSDTSPYLQTEAPRSSCFTEGRFSDAQSHFDFPGTDQELYAIDGGKHMVVQNMYMPKEIWGEPLVQPKMTKYADVSEDMRAKQAGATAFLLKKEGVMCEMFASTNFGVEPSVLKHIAAFQIMQGVTFAVIHRWDYRFKDRIKYFAPPDFSDKSMLKYSIDVINENIARLTCMMKKGKSIFPVALIDPTEYVWRNNYDKKPYLDAFARLNRKPYGFTICDVKRLTENDYGFKVAVYAGIELSEETVCAIEKKGIKVVPYEKLDDVGKYVESPAVYKGEGTPHFVRKIIDGEEFTFIANIESETPIKGVVSAYGKTKGILLYPGDIRYISENYDDIPEAEIKGRFICDLPEPANVSFDRPNIIQLEYFTADGQTVTKLGDERVINFAFTAEKEIPLKLYVPCSCDTVVTKVKFNGTTEVAISGKVFDEDYKIYDFGTCVNGNNVITLEKNGAINFYERIILKGDFDVAVNTDKTYYKQVIKFYNYKMFIPQKAEIHLSERRKIISINQSAALQGQPFYSGGIRYLFNIKVDESGKYVLDLPCVRDVAFLSVNNRDLGKKVMPPYTFSLELNEGNNEIVISVYNSLANAMECYLEESGILSGGKLYKVL